MQRSAGGKLTKGETIDDRIRRKANLPSNAVLLPLGIPFRATRHDYHHFTTNTGHAASCMILSARLPTIRS
jgi:hypothetical protein